MKNLVLGYVLASSSKKPDILKLIGKILDFSSAEFEQVTKTFPYPSR